VCLDSLEGLTQLKVLHLGKVCVMGKDSSLN
jgi:hypothetical protein